MAGGISDRMRWVVKVESRDVGMTLSVSVAVLAVVAVGGFKVGGASEHKTAGLFLCEIRGKGSRSQAGAREVGGRDKGGEFGAAV